MKINLFAALFMSLSVCCTAQAGVLAAKTRIIFNAGEREQSLMLANTNQYSIILQTWIDQGEGSPEATDMPFLVLPPVMKMPSEGVQGIQIVYNGKPLRADRETVFWLNLYEIPMIKQHKDQDSYISLAMNTQLKLFYRPKQMVKMSPEAIADKLEFTIRQENGHAYLECNNETPYHASLINLRLTQAEHSIAVQSEMDMMSYPYAKKRYVLDGTLSAQTGYILQFDLLDDQGNAQPFQKNLAPIQL